MTRKGKILVVDDDRLVLATVTHGLSQAGYEVIDADNGDDAILLARQQQPELALLDIRMEGLTGFDVAEYLRDVARVPFMFLSAFADDDTRAKVDALGALAYLVKPLDVGQIVPTVDAVMLRVRGQLGAAPDLPGVFEPPHAPEPAATESGDLVATATGILMHRHSLTRQQALGRLRRLAHDKALSLSDQASRVVDAVEALAGSSDQD